MTYTKLNMQNGHVVVSSDMGHIEDGIYNNDVALASHKTDANAHKDAIESIAGDVVDDHDTDSSAHPDIRLKITDDISSHNSSASAHSSAISSAVSSGINAHNSDSAAHTSVIDGKVSTHNSSSSAHQDIRNSIPTYLNQLLDTADCTCVTAMQKMKLDNALTTDYYVTEEWTFTMEGGLTTTKKVVIYNGI